MAPVYHAQELTLPHMPQAKNINPLERLILLSADEEGRIPFFRWQASGADGGLKALTLMERMGYLRREPGGKFCRAFHLTEVGRVLRGKLLARLRKLEIKLQPANECEL